LALLAHLLLFGPLSLRAAWTFLRALLAGRRALPLLAHFLAWLGGRLPRLSGGLGLGARLARLCGGAPRLRALIAGLSLSTLLAGRAALDLWAALALLAALAEGYRWRGPHEESEAHGCHKQFVIHGYDPLLTCVPPSLLSVAPTPFTLPGSEAGGLCRQ
jgi:hypothetical protein